MTSTSRPSFSTITARTWRHIKSQEASQERRHRAAEERSVCSERQELQDYYDLASRLSDDYVIRWIQRLLSG